MSDTSSGLVNYIIPISLTVGTMVLPAIEDNISDLNNIGMYIPPQEMGTGIDENERGSYSSILSNQNQDIEYMTVLHEFVSSLVKESKDVDIDIVEAVNEHFWDLI